MPLAAMAPAPIDAAAEESNEATVVYDRAEDAEGAESPEEGKGVAEAIGSVFDKVGVDLSGLREDIVTGLSTSLETAKTVAREYANEKALTFETQDPHRNRPSADPKRSRTRSRSAISTSSATTIANGRTRRGGAGGSAA